MRRSYIIARELRGVVVVVLVAVLIVWLFAKINDDRAEAKAQRESRNTTTTVATTSTTTTTIIVDNDERLCSIASAFRDDLAALSVTLVSPGGAARSTSLPIDVGYAATEGDDEPVAEPPPRIVDPERIDPIASGLLGEPQRVAQGFYTAASTLRLGLIDADFDATADYLADFIAVAEAYGWNLEEITASSLSDRWTALTTQPPVGVENSLSYIGETCGLAIGPGFVYREPAPDLPVLDQVLVPAEIDPAVDPAARPRPPGNADGDG